MIGKWQAHQTLPGKWALYRAQWEEARNLSGRICSSERDHCIPIEPNNQIKPRWIIVKRALCLLLNESTPVRVGESQVYHNASAISTSEVYIGDSMT